MALTECEICVPSVIWGVRRKRPSRTTERISCVSPLACSTAASDSRRRRMNLKRMKRKFSSASTMPPVCTMRSTEARCEAAASRSVVSSFIMPSSARLLARA